MQRFDTVITKWRRYKEQRRPWRNQDMSNNTNRTLRSHLRHADINPDRPLSIHTLRKSCIKNWAKVNRDPNVTRELSGHASLKTTMEYYNQVTTEDKVEAAKGIESLVSEQRN